MTTKSLAAAPARTRGCAYRFYQTFTRVDAFKCSFFPSAIRLRNKSTQELVSQTSVERFRRCLLTMPTQNNYTVLIIRYHIAHALIYYLTTQTRHILTKTDPNRHYITRSHAIVITARKYSSQIYMWLK